MRRAGALVACAVLCAVVPAITQDSARKPQQPTFRSSVDLILLDVSVLDGSRTPVRGLTAGDFTVLQDGRQQPITAFAAIDLPDRAEPTAAGWMQEVRPDVGRNDDSWERRIVAVVLDDATPMPAEEVPRMKTLARRVIERLGPADLAAVVFPFNKKAGQEFTSDRARLLAAVDRFNGSIDNMSILGPFADDPLQAKTISLAFDQYNPKALQLYSAVVGTLKGLADYLSDLPERRKALVFCSVGLPLDVEQAQAPPISLENPTGDTAGGALMLFRDLQATFEAAQRANVNVYGLEPGGLRAPIARYDALSGTGSLDGGPGKLNRDFLHALSVNTGGFTLAESNEFDAAVTQMLRENGSYYLLGYSRPAPHADGRFRRVEVRVNRPNMTVRARNGYYEPRASRPGTSSSSPALAQALASLLPKADVAMQVAAAPLAVTGKREAAVAVAVGVRQPAHAGDRRLTDDVEMQVNAYDPDGKPCGSRHLTGRVTLKPGVQAGAEYDMLARLDLPPGRYQLRVALQSSLQGKSGSVFCDLDVPDFANLPLSLSGVLITANPGSVAAPRDALASLLPVTPTSSRSFSKDQQVTALLHVYQGRAAASGGAGEAGGAGTGAPARVVPAVGATAAVQPIVPVPMSVTIFDASGAMVFNASPTLGVERFAKDRAADCAFELPVADVQPGPHLLRIEARLGELTVRRDVRFEVR